MCREFFSGGKNGSREATWEVIAMAQVREDGMDVFPGVVGEGRGD